MREIETIYNYNIHDIVKFKVIDRAGKFRSLFGNIKKHYEYFFTNQVLNEPDLIIEIGKFSPQIDNSLISGGGRYYFKQDYLYVPRESYKGATWSFEIIGIDSTQTLVNIDCNLFGKMFVTGNVVDFLIHKKLVDKGYPLLHASAVCNKEKGFIFSSRGGAGKTTIAMEMAQRGFDFLSDNYISVNNGNIVGHPTSLSIFTYNLAPIIAKNMTKKEKLQLTLKRYIYKATGGYAKFFTKINPARIFGNIEASAPISALFVFLPHEGPVHFEEISRLEAVERLLLNQMLEFPFFNRYITEYSFALCGTSFATHWNKYREVLDDNLPYDIPFVKVYVPTRYDESLFGQLINLINKYGGGD